MAKVFVTGIGTISSIGQDVTETLNSLESQKRGISRLEFIPTRHSKIMAGQIKLQNTQLAELLNISDLNLYSRAGLLGTIAVREAIHNAKIEDIYEYQTGLISATTTGGAEVGTPFFDDKDCGCSTERIADFVGIKDYLATVKTACSSSANAIMLGARLIKQGVLDRVVAGGTDSLSRFTINGFHSLKILDPEICKPFDANRNGLNLGEGAGYIVLESEKSCKNKQILAELSGYGNANDAFHQTATSPAGEGAFLAMQKALSLAHVNSSDIDYINAHGTGTEINDLSEGTAISNIFNEVVPHISSTKGYTGHTLGASGGSEAVFSILSLNHNTIFPNLNYKDKMPELNFVINAEVKKNKEIKHVLSNSFGFGGNCTSLIFSN